MIQVNVPQSVLQAYGLEAATVTGENFKEKKGVWYLTSDQCVWVLKKSPLNPARLRFVLEASAYLNAAGAGFRIPDTRPALNGDLFVVAEGSPYYVTTYVPGRPPRYDSQAEMGLVMRTLARFHRASAGFTPGSGSEPRSHLGSWPREYSHHLDDLKLDPGAGEFGRLVSVTRPTFLDMGRQALQRLECSHYYEWVKDLETTGGLCHQDFVPGNLMLDREGEIYVLDLDSLTQEIPARDLRKILNKFAKRKGWDKTQVETLVACYHQENPLSAKHYQVLEIDLQFPHLYHGVVSKYTRGRAPEWSEEKFARKLREVLSLEWSKDAMLRAGLTWPSTADEKRSNSDEGE